MTGKNFKCETNMDKTSLARLARRYNELRNKKKSKPIKRSDILNKIEITCDDSETSVVRKSLPRSHPLGCSKTLKKGDLFQIEKYNGVTLSPSSIKNLNGRTLWDIATSEDTTVQPVPEDK